MKDEDGNLRFPSGRSVNQVKRDAKALKKAEGITHYQALDRLTRENGLDMPFSRAIAKLRRGPDA